MLDAENIIDTIEKLEGFFKLLFEVEPPENCWGLTILKSPRSSP